MAAADDISKLLGVDENVGPAARIKQVRDGLPYAALERIREYLDLTTEELARAVAISPRTLARRKEEDRLKLEESDRIARLARVLVHAVGVMGSAEKASRWLKRPNPTLDGLSPLEVLDTDLGSQLVDELLTRIEYGVLS